MKNIIQKLTIAAVALAAMVQIASAQQVQMQATVVANVTSNFVGTAQPLRFDVRGQKNVAIRWELGLTGAGTEVMGVRLFPSVDGTTLPTSPTLATGYSMAIAANGTTRVCVETNFDTLGYPFLIGGYITNGNASVNLTNTFTYTPLYNTGK